MRLNLYRKWALVLIFFMVSGAALAQEDGSVSLTKSELKQQKRDSVRASKKVWTSVLGGPSYTPEASVGVAGALLLSFKTNQSDTVSQRSFFPFGINMSINGTLVVAGAGTLFFNEDRFRIYTSYGYRNEPSNFYGVGFDEIESVERGDETTLYSKSAIYFVNRFLWQVKENLFAGPVMDINYSSSFNMCELMAGNEYVNRYETRYTNIGVGAQVQYDSRDDVATPNSGMLVSVMGKAFGRYLGGSYNYGVVDMEYRQFKPLFRRATLAWTTRSQMSFGDVPFTELPSFGSPFDLRGFYWGKYRDRSMGYGIAEFRHMLGSSEAVSQGRFISKLGYATWVGAGTLGADISQWNRWKANYGVGLRVQIQPRKNFRLDIGKGVGEDGLLVYFNMTEAF